MSLLAFADFLFLVCSVAFYSFIFFISFLCSIVSPIKFAGIISIFGSFFFCFGLLNLLKRLSIDFSNLLNLPLASANSFFVRRNPTLSKVTNLPPFLALNFAILYKWNSLFFHKNQFSAVFNIICIHNSYCFAKSHLFSKEI